MTRFLALTVLTVLPAVADWSEPVEVRMGDELCVVYQSKLAGDALVVRVTPAKGWHTFTMDNERRAKEALNGKMVLGVDGPTVVSLGEGLKTTGDWLQSEPDDFSKPELRWYSWGYEDPALFAVRVERSGSGAALIGVRGQACDATRCKNIDVEWLQSLGGGATDADLSGLIPVRR